MTLRDLLSRLQEWDKHHPELLDQPALFAAEHGDDVGEAIEIDDINHIDLDGEDSLDPRITQNTILILEP